MDIDNLINICQVDDEKSDYYLNNVINDIEKIETPNDINNIYQVSCIKNECSIIIKKIGNGCNPTYIKEMGITKKGYEYEIINYVFSYNDINVAHKECKINILGYRKIRKKNIYFVYNLVFYTFDHIKLGKHLADLISVDEPIKINGFFRFEKVTINNNIIKREKIGNTINIFPGNIEILNKLILLE